MGQLFREVKVSWKVEVWVIVYHETLIESGYLFHDGSYGCYL